MTDTTADYSGTFGTRDATNLPRADLYFVDSTGGSEKARDERLESLLARSLDPESLDWDALARIDIEGWGADDSNG
jgi:hypothetical protein